MRFYTPKIKIQSWLLAIAFLAVQAIALAHEIKHDLQQHNDPSCVLHLHAKQSGDTPSAQLRLTAPLAFDTALFTHETRPLVARWALPYKSRAPPFPFSS